VIFKVKRMILNYLHLKSKMLADYLKPAKLLNINSNKLLELLKLMLLLLLENH